LEFGFLFDTKIVQISILEEFTLYLKNCVEILRVFLLSLVSRIEGAASLVHDAGHVLKEMLVRLLLWEFMQRRRVHLDVNGLVFHTIVAFIE